MPHFCGFAPAEPFVTHNGVTVYHVYRHNQLDDGARLFIYCMHDDGDDDVEDEWTFDVRDRCDLREESLDGIRDAICRAIDDGTLTAPDVCRCHEADDDYPPVDWVPAVQYGNPLLDSAEFRSHLNRLAPHELEAAVALVHKLLEMSDRHDIHPR